MNQEMSEALAAVLPNEPKQAPQQVAAPETKPAKPEASQTTATMTGKDMSVLSRIVPTGKAKIPAGKTLVAIRLGRDESVSNTRMTAVESDWLVDGMVVAIRNGHFLDGNYVYGRFSGGIPKVTACHKVRCAKCGSVKLKPLAVFDAKDAAREANPGVDEECDLDRDISGHAILRKFGYCQCGGRWQSTRMREKSDLLAFTQEVLRDVERGGDVGKFLRPRAFVVRPVEEARNLGADWEWLQLIMTKNMKAVVPFSRHATGPVWVYNPGYWYGWVDNYDDTGLFFLEHGKDRLGRGRLSAETCTPTAFEGL